MKNTITKTIVAALALLCCVSACGRDAMPPVVSEPLSTPVETETTALAAEVGDTVAFGAMDGEALLWRVLALDAYPWDTYECNNRFPHPEKVAAAVQAAAKGSYRLPKTVNDSVNQVLSISISSIRAMQAQVKALDKEIERQL